MPTTGVNAVASTVAPWAVQQRINTSAGRYALDSMLMPRTDSGLSYIDYRSGVMASGDGNTTHLAMQVTAGAGMSVNVAQGNCVINTSNQGAYMCCLAASTNITIPASSSSQNRYDLVIARVYDDNNSALSGAAGVRQMTVELVQGDYASGTPTVPTSAMPAGSITLASIYVGKNASSIVAANITDMRGPGIVARGGMRALYGADAQPGSAAFAAPGAYPGDQRWVHNNVFQHQVYYGSSQGWRGVHNCLVYTQRPSSSLDGTWLKGVGNRRELCRLTIPDPGTPYMVYPTVLAFMSLSVATCADLFVAIGSLTGPQITRAIQDSGPLVTQAGIADTQQGWQCPPIMWGPLTGATTLIMGTSVVASTDATNTGTGFSGAMHAGDGLLSVNVYPSTVAPPS